MSFRCFQHIAQRPISVGVCMSSTYLLYLTHSLCIIAYVSHRLETTVDQNNAPKTTICQDLKVTVSCLSYDFTSSPQTEEAAQLSRIRLFPYHHSRRPVYLIGAVGICNNREKETVNNTQCGRVAAECVVAMPTVPPFMTRAISVGW